MLKTDKSAKREKTLINISKKTFFQVTALLAALLVISIVLTYLIPGSEFGTLEDGSPNYLEVIPRPDIKGVPILKGVLAPILVFASGDGLTLIMLSLFLFVISAAFQVMNDAGGIRALVGEVSRRYRNRRRLLLVIVSFLFYCFGAFLGLFEEMLTMMPIVAALCVMLGYDSFTGFLCSILSCGFGFAGAITNPFTVLLASEIVGVNPMVNIWYRVFIFAVMFGLLQAFLFVYVRRLEQTPSSSCTLRHDEALRDVSTGEEAPDEGQERRLRWIYAVFLLAALSLIVVSSLLSALRSYTVVILIVYFLFGGLLAGSLACGSFKTAGKSFLRGLLGALPTIVFIAFAASAKFVFEEGGILPTIVNQLNLLIEGHSPVLVALVIYLIVLVLEFFISSSTAKAILVMGLLAVVNTGLTKEMLVLLFTFGDGYTNVLFPTSPVLLIGLSMIEMDYFRWLKKSWALFLVNFLMVLGFIVLGVVIGY